jgi:chromosome segregation protein
MKLKKIELFGFKSFADKTEVTFDTGVTCVVGPNGCGKSNISDAIRWVLGERSAKLLRGSKMEDVIFNGTDFRKPLALAEVSLTIDNATRGLPIDYNEVTITRRLYRSGESEYLVNKTVCRLKDIQDLILDTGIGSSSYSMIEQGRIDYILNADADERRFLIEEAAGISKYKVKKEEAIRKLERTEENRLRLNDIVQEVQRNIQYAERQAKRASRYQELFEKLKDLEIKKAIYEQQLISQERAGLEGLQGGLRTDLSAQDEAMNRLRNEQESLAQYAREISQRYETEENHRHQILSKLDQILQTLAFHQEKRVEMANRLGQIEQERIQLFNQTEKNAGEIESKQTEINGFAAERLQAEGALARAQERLRLAEDNVRTAKQQMEAIKIESMEVAAELSRMRNEYHRMTVFLDTRQEQKKHRQADAQRLQQEAGSWNAKKESCSGELLAMEEKFRGLKLRKEQLDTQLIDMESDALAKEDALKHLEHDLREFQTQLKMLSEIESAFLKNENALLSEEDGFRREWVRTVRDVLRVQEGYEWALDAALDSYANSMIVEDQSNAEILLERIRNRRPASMGLLVKSNVSSDLEWMENEGRIEHPLILCALSDLVEVDPEYKDVFLPFLAGTYLVKTLSADQLTEILPLAQEYRIISEDGMILGPYGVMLFRNNYYSSDEPSFKRRAEIEMIENKISQIEGDIESAKNDLKENSCQMTALKEEQESLETQIMDVAIQKESYDSLRQGMEDRLGSYQRELDLIYIETQQMQETEQEALAQKSRIEADLKVIEAREQQVHQRQNDAVVAIEYVDQKRTEALGEFAEAKVRWEGIEENNRLLEGSLKVLVETDARDRKRIEALEIEVREIDRKEKQLLEDDQRLKNDQVQYEEKRSHTENEIGAIRQQKEKAEADLTDIQGRLEAFRSEQQAMNAKMHDFEMKMMDLSFKEKTIVERLLQTYKVRLSDIEPANYVLLPEALPGMDETLAELRDKVENIGTVNLLAIEEYEELKTRYEFLLAQQKDLEDAKDQLMETIRKINKTTKGLFEETFQNVQIAFQKYYETLFQGGYAKLMLVDETNPLESGIDIVVRPPAKKPTHITLLSGGEKALTAIALLFALFKIKPSPFCVLDEVDAPLDEANVDRFLSVLREFLAQTQFIIVTHNRKTIAIGDSLFGVTMQEPGCSKIVSVKVNQLGDGAEQKKSSHDEDAVSLDELIPVKSGSPVR